jgi:hypothetical protein
MKWLRDQGDYNDGGLRALKDEALALSKEEGVPAFDNHAEMTAVLAKAKKDGVDMGKDGIHPDEGGSLIMAYGLLKALGVPERHETLTVDLSGRNRKPLRASVVRREPGAWKVRVTLDGLPYAVERKARKMLPYLPFMGEFNDIRIAFAGLPEGSRYYLKLDGALTGVMTGAELEKGLAVAELPGCGPMTAASRVGAVTREKCNLYRQMWRAIALPDNYGINADYDPKPHLLGMKLSAEMEQYRASLCRAPAMTVEVVRVDTLPAHIKAGDAISRWSVSNGFSPRPPAGGGKEDAVKLSDPASGLAVDWPRVVLDAPDMADHMKCAYEEGNPWGFKALAVLESDSAQEVVVHLEGREDCLAYFNGREAPWMAREDKERDLRLSLRAGRNLLVLALWNDKRAMKGFRAVIKSADAPVRNSF